MNTTDFENEAKDALIKTLSKYSTGINNSLVNGYLYHLRRLRLFLATDGTTEPGMLKQEKIANYVYAHQNKMVVIVPDPSIDQVEFYLEKWNSLEEYNFREDALN